MVVPESMGNEKVCGKGLSIFPDIGSVIPIYQYLGQKSRTFVALAYAAPSIIIRDVD